MLMHSIEEPKLKKASEISPESANGQPLVDAAFKQNSSKALAV
jgi:hypothetical protein